MHIQEKLLNFVCLVTCYKHGSVGQGNSEKVNYDE